MKVVVAGGKGFIGSKLLTLLKQGGHEVVAASRSTGIDAVTGTGLREALQSAQVVVDVMNSPSFEDSAVMEFFKTTTRNLLAAEAALGVAHHVALSVVGIDRSPTNGYFRAKAAQEKLIEAATIPFTIVRATQFFEFVGGIAQFSMVGDAIHAPTALMQPLAADDVAAFLAEVVVDRPHDSIVELAGPEPIRLDEFVRRYIVATHDRREVVSDPNATYFGAALDDRSLMPGANPRLGSMRYDEWLSRTLAQA